MTVSVTTSKNVHEFERVVTPITRTKIKGEWKEKGGAVFYICLDCRHWHERSMATAIGGFTFTCICGCHEIHYTEIHEES